MKISFRSLVAIASIACLTVAVRAADAGFVDFGKFETAPGRQFVQIDVGRGLLRFAGLIARCSEHEAADVISGLTRVRVNVIGLDETNRESTTAKVQAIRSNLAAKGWEPIVTAKDKGEDVAIFVKQRSDDAIEAWSLPCLAATRARPC